MNDFSQRFGLSLMLVTFESFECCGLLMTVHMICFAFKAPGAEKCTKCCQLTKVYRSNVRKVYQSQLQSQNVNHSINEDVVQLYTREKKTPAFAISTHVALIPMRQT